MSDFDRTKKAIGIGNLDEAARKNMFEKFKSAGGKVVNEKPSPQKENDPRKPRQSPKIIQGQVSRTEFDRSTGSRTGSRAGSRGSHTRGGEEGSKSSQANQTEKELGSFPNRLAIKLKCWFARVTPFGSRTATPSVMGIFARELKSALIEMRLAGNELLTNSSHSPKIAQALDKVNPTYLEVLAMGHKLYNESELEELLQPYNLAPDSYVPLEKIKSPLYSLFRKLYLLYPFQETYKKAINLAYEHLQKLEGKPSMIYNSRKKKLLSEVDSLFGTIYEKMYLLIIRSEEKNIPIVSRYMEQVLGIHPEDKPGHRLPGQSLVEDTQPAEATTQTKEEKKDKEEKPEVPKEIAYGLKLMQIHSIEQLRKKYDPKGELSSIPDSDKALLTYLFFKEFDDNYSFVMTTKKIDLKQIHVNGTRVDYRQKLLDQYESARTVLDQFKIYIETYKEYMEHKANPGTNYIEASKKTSTLETKRGTHSRNVRAITKDFMLKTAAILQVLIQDMRTKREIVGNMDDIMQFDLVESKKRLNNKPVKTCITDSYCFAKAFAERLEAGDLYGGVLELTPEQMKESFGIEMKDAEPESISEPTPDDSALEIESRETQDKFDEKPQDPEKLDSDTLGIQL